MSYSLRHLPSLPPNRFFFFDTIVDRIVFYNYEKNRWEVKNEDLYFGAIHSKDLCENIFSFKSKNPRLVIRELRRVAKDLYGDELS